MSINTLILIPAIFSMGIFFEQSKRIQEDPIHLKMFKENQSKIYEYVMTHCSQLLHYYPEFEIFAKVNVCVNFNLSLKIGKVVLLLSTLFNTCIPYGLYGPPLLPVIITGITSGILFYTNFTDSEWRISVLESFSILSGYSIIFCHYLFPGFDEYWTKKLLKRRRSSSRDNNQSIYDNMNDEKFISVRKTTRKLKKRRR